MKKWNNQGQGLTEYIILVLLVSVTAIVAVRALGGTLKIKIQEARNHINSEVVLSEKN